MRHASIAAEDEDDGSDGSDNGSDRHAYHAYRGKFLDTLTFARALLGPGKLDLKSLGDTLGVAHPKIDTDEHGTALTPEYLDYATRDVRTTWEVYQALRDLYRHHGVYRQWRAGVGWVGKEPWQVYSEASLGKAYLDVLGVPPFLTAHPEVPPAVHGYGMAAYYGGRSEVGIRHVPTEVLYLDFKSQYASVNALLGVQDLLLAERVEVRDATGDVRAWLQEQTGAELLAELQRPETWRRLRMLCRVRPDGDLLPVRATFGERGEQNLALCALYGPPIWFTLADVLAAKLLAPNGRGP